MKSQLNDEQLQAVTTTEGFVRVVAGAGTGKTRALTYRFAFLINELGILPENILCVTFTNKAANEMRRRIHNLIGDNDTGYINTFHGFCVAILQEDSHAVQYPRSFLVLDNSDIDDILRIIYEERGLTLRDMTFSDARNMIEIQKLFKRPDYYLDMIDMSLDALRQKYLDATTPVDIIFYGYLYQEKKCFGLDYNDLIKFALYIFNRNEDILRKWQERLEYIMIDEFQDIDSLQYELMETLCGYHNNLFIVGDPDQTIYTWRGANVKYLLDFDKQFPSTQTIMLLSNYRSTPQILDVANALIDKNTNRIKKSLRARLPEGQEVPFHFATNADKEAEWIVEQMKELNAEGVEFRDMTVLYRAHYISRAIEEAMLKAKIPYHIYSGVSFYGRAEIKDSLSYMRMAVAQDDISFRRIVNKPKRNMGKRRMEFLENYATENNCTLYNALKATLDDPIFRGTKAQSFVDLIEEFSTTNTEIPVSDFLAAILNRSGYETMLRTEGSQERLDNLAELKQSIHEYEITCGEEASAARFISHVAMLTNADTNDTSNRVKLMTVHAAKGLEFPYVFLCGMNEGIFPTRKVKDLPGMEEERRIAFVAMTRAEKRLFLSAAEGRNFDGSPRYPSRFIIDAESPSLVPDKSMPETLIRETKDYLHFLAPVKASMPDNSPAFTEGTRIAHNFFGGGTIVNIDHAKATYTIQFDGAPTPRVISMKVKLTPL